MTKSNNGRRKRNPMVKKVKHINNVKKLPMTLLIIVILNFLSGAVQANESYFNEHARGWHWYEDPKKEAEVQENEAMDPIDEMNALHLTIERALDKAVLYP